MKKIRPLLYLSLLVCGLCWLTPAPAPAMTFENVDCAACHQGTLSTNHHLAALNQNLGCEYCHIYTNVKGAWLITTNKNCSQCHNGSGHEALHDKPAFTGTPQGETACRSCHQVFAGDHLARGYSCDTCHKSTKPAVLAAIAKGSGSTGKTVLCVDCHSDPKVAFGIHNAQHDLVCAVCHVLPKKADGTILSIHDRAGAQCIQCHRLGTTATQRNTIFSVQVNASANEPPDFNYNAMPYLNGPCLNCHKQNKTNMGGAGSKGCLPCHFSKNTDSWPTELNGWMGSPTWGHNFVKRNNPTKTISGK